MATGCLLSLLLKILAKPLSGELGMIDGFHGTSLPPHSHHHQLFCFLLCLDICCIILKYMLYRDVLALYVAVSQQFNT
jgi:hypothetical protein